MEVSESEVREWYAENAISDADWDSLPEFQQGMVAIEAVADSWSEVVSMREVGIPEDAVLLFFEPSAIGLDASEVSHRAEARGFESLTSYVLQETSSENICSLFSSETIGVVSVSMREGQDDEPYLVLECEADTSVFE